MDRRYLEEEERLLEDFGIIIGNPGFLPHYSGRKNLRMLAMIRGKCGKEKIDLAMRQVGLDPEMSRKVSEYSMGMKQRLGIAQAIMEENSILILDEPMNGLDNQGGEEAFSEAEGRRQADSFGKPQFRRYRSTLRSSI